MINAPLYFKKGKKKKKDITSVSKYGDKLPNQHNTGQGSIPGPHVEGSLLVPLHQK